MHKIRKLHAGVTVTSENPETDVKTILNWILQFENATLAMRKGTENKRNCTNEMQKTSATS